jgi:hypothetical protein
MFVGDTAYIQVWFEGWVFVVFLNKSSEQGNVARWTKNIGKSRNKIRRYRRVFPFDVDSAK